MSNLNTNTNIEYTYEFKDSKVNGSCEMSELVAKAVSSDGASCDCYIEFTYYGGAEGADHSTLIANYVDGKVLIEIEGLNTNYYEEGYSWPRLDYSDVSDINIESITNVVGENEIELKSKPEFDAIGALEY